MDVGEGRELPSAGGELDDETIAKKRSRRVSFAETTAVHVFDRDEDFDTPPESRPPAEGDAGGPDPGRGAAAGFGGDHSDSDDSRGSVREEVDEVDDEEEGEQEKFVRDMDSSSPGSAVGSVTSNDDDNFFGPVSTSFIRSGRLSEAGMSDDDNHDITLDSTAFSLHYRSNIGPLDDLSAHSAGSLRTPTGDTVPAATADLMAQKESRKLFLKNKLSDGKPSGSGGESTSMSLIVDNPGRYDYGKLSPTLEALLDQVNKSMQSNSPNSGSRIGTVDQHASDVVDVKESGRIEKHTVQLVAVEDAADSPGSGDSIVNSDLDTSKVARVKESGKHERDNGNAVSLENGVRKPCFDSHILKSLSISSATNQIDGSNHSPIIKASLPMDASVNEISLDMISPLIEDVHETCQSDMVVSSPRNSCMLSPAHRRSGNSFIMQSDHVHQTLFKDELSKNKSYSTFSPQSAMVDPLLVITDGGQQLLESECGLQTPKNAVQILQSPLLGSISSLRAKRQQLFLDSTILPHDSAREESPSFFDMELVRHEERMSAIKDHISKSKVLETPGRSNSKLATPGKDLMLPGHQGSSERRARDLNLNYGGLPMISTKENLTNSIQKNRALIINVESKHAGFGTPNVRQLAWTDKNEVIGESVKPTEVISSCDFPNSEMNMKQSPLASCVLIEAVAVVDVHGSSQNQTAVELKESSRVSDTLYKDNHLDFHSIQEPVPIQDFDSVGKRRRIDQNLITEDDNVGKTGRAQKSPKVSSTAVVNRSVISHGHQVECNSRADDISEKLTDRCWTEILTKLSEATRLTFSPSIHELRLQELDNLEDVLDQLQMARKYERLSTSLKNHDRLVEMRQQRVADIRSLQDKLLYERAKLELKRAKLDLLRKRAQLNQSGRQECNNLKAMVSQLSLLNKGAAWNVESHRQSFLSSSKSQDENSRVISMRQELKMLEQKVEYLVRSLETTCKIKGNPNCDGIIKSASELLEKRTCCRMVCQNLQLWKLCDIVTRNEQHDIVLNYCDLLFQRFTINSGRVSSIVASNTLNHANVEKTFPNMNSIRAFEFVFKAKGDDRLAISKFIQQKTLETSLLLGALIDVLNEVHAAGMEVLNLISSTFDFQPCTGQLELHICFMNFQSGQKVTLSLDVTDLKCAVYPSEPSELQLKVLGSETTLPPSVTDATLAVIQNLQGGRMMILRLCRSISQVVQTSSR